MCIFICSTFNTGNASLARLRSFFFFFFFNRKLIAISFKITHTGKKINKTKFHQKENELAGHCPRPSGKGQRVWRSLTPMGMGSRAESSSS